MVIKILREKTDMGNSKGIAALVGFLFVIGIAMMLGAGSGECAWCPSINCYGAGQCGNDCVCVTPSGSTQGSCFSIE